jgi:hypothetical protein
MQGITRLTHAWGALEPEQRLAAAAALALWVTLLLPWYHKDVTETVHGRLQAVGHDVTGFGAFSFVEAAVLLVSVGVLAMLWARGEDRRFHMPGSDGLIVMLAGGWMALLVFYRMLDTPSLSQHGGSVVTDVGVQWGIFIALLAAAGLAYAGWRMRVASAPEPPLLRGRPRGHPRRRDSTGTRRTSTETGHQPGEDVTVVAPAPARATRAAPVPARATPVSPPARPASPPAAPISPPAPARRKRPRYPPAPGEQLSFEDPQEDRDA